MPAIHLKICKSVQNKRLILLTNIPTPYRVKLYNLLHDECERYNIAFEVWFMAPTEPGRFWQIDLSQWSFRGRILPGLHPRFRSAVLHINPQAWLDLVLDPPDWLILSGWQIPTNIIAQFIPTPQAHKLIWAEANRSSSLYTSGVVSRYRRWVLEKASAIIIPGEIARTTLQNDWRVRPRNLLYLPNLVDESLFRDRVTELRVERQKIRAKYNISAEKRVLFWSARLIDKNKGITNFLNAVHELPLTILLAGEGSDRSTVEDWANRHPHFDLRLLGHLSMENVLECLALSDVAMLASFSDPNPLSMIEAIWAGLPILTSIHCGNWPETLMPEVNGWLINPSDPSEIYAVAKKIVMSDAETLIQMGQQSLNIAQQHFDSTFKVKAFISSLLEILPPKGN